MLEWMIALTALCGAVAGAAILYLTLRAGLQVRADDATPRATRRGRIRLGRVSTDLPRAKVHRSSPLLGMRRRLARARA